MSINIDAILMNRAKFDELPADFKANIKALFAALHDLETAYLADGGKPFVVSSGYRPANINAAIGGAAKSLHMICKACDIVDLDGKLDAWCTAHQSLLQTLHLWQEHPDSTKNWTHLDIGIRPAMNRPDCGSRQFRP